MQSHLIDSPAYVNYAVSQELHAETLGTLRLASRHMLCATTLKAVATWNPEGVQALVCSFTPTGVTHTFDRYRIRANR